MTEADEIAETIQRAFADFAKLPEAERDAILNRALPDESEQVRDNVREPLEKP